MIRCYFLALGLLFCTEKNVDVKCIEDTLTHTILRDSNNVENVINYAVERCLIDISGCCSWHGGVLTYNQDDRTAVCRDGTLSPSCKFRG